MAWIWRSRWVGSVSADATEHGRRARRHDNRSLRRVLGHIIVNPILVVGAVGNDGGERLVDLVEQRAEFGGIVDLLAGQGRGDDRAGLRIDAQVQLPPGAAALGAMLLDQPFARPAQLHAGAVDQQVHRSARRLRSHRQCPGSSAQCRMVRHRQIQPHQLEQRADQPLGLAQRLVKHCPQDQRCLDGEIRVARLTARRGPRRRPPSCDASSLNQIVSEPRCRSPAS